MKLSNFSSKIKLFLIIFAFTALYSKSSFAAEIAVASATTTCNTALCANATTVGVHSLKYPTTANPIIGISFNCPAADTCQNLCISECNKFKKWIENPGIADAQSNVSSNSFTRSICNALKVVTGSAGKTFAAFAIIAVGIGFFSGKVSWGLMIGVAAGIAAMFGAPSIVAAISGQDTKTDCNIN